MRFLEEPEIQAWLERQAIRIDPPFRVERRVRFSRRARPGTLQAAARACVAGLGPWSSCLLLVTEWSIWASGEDWPAYYAVRGGQGEKRSIEVAPGHLFQAREGPLLAVFLARTLGNGWDGLLLPAGRGRAEAGFVSISHDGWLETRIPS
jgi:hypothetical protein